MVPIEHVYEQIRTFAADAGARKVVLFGSRAKGVNRPKSDIDLAVAGCPDFNRLEQNLQDNLWSLLKVDVINLDEPISSSLRAEIERSGKVLYEKIGLSLFGVGEWVGGGGGAGRVVWGYGYHVVVHRRPATA